MGFYDSLLLYLKFKVWAKLRMNRLPSFYTSHSQFGEDMVVRALLGERSSGIYVDIGAHHPVYFSNTYHFYCRGWRGLNVDAQPGSMRAFALLRPRDINVEAAVGPETGAKLTFHRFDSPALNTLDPEAAAEAVGNLGARLIGTDEVTTRTLGELLGKYLPDTQIDFLSIDVEGMDELILRSNDWTRFKPTVVVFERQCVTLQDLDADPLLEYLRQLGYSLEAKCGHSIVVADRTNAK